MSIDTKGLAKIGYYIICFLLIASIVPCSLYLYNDISATSKTFGTLKTYDIYSDFNVYEYDISDAIFYRNNYATGYIFSKEYPVASDFDGEQNRYNLLVNNQPCNYEIVTAGILYGENTLSFYDVYGAIIQEVTLNIQFTFYLSKINLEIETLTNANGLSLLNEYTKFNSLKIRIIEGQYISSATQSNQVMATWIDYDGEVLAVGYYTKGSVIVTPNDPVRTGYLFIGWSPEVSNYIYQNTTYVAQYRIDNGNILPTVINLTFDRSTAFGQQISNSFSLNLDVHFPIAVDFSIFDGTTVVMFETLITTQQQNLNGTVFPTECVSTYLYPNNDSNKVLFQIMAKHASSIIDGEVVISNEITGVTFRLSALDSNITDAVADYISNHWTMTITAIREV